MQNRQLISVEHVTTYRYEGPVALQPHTLRLKPRTDASQRLLSFAIHVSPLPARQAECTDQDGNLVLETWFSGLTHELRIENRFTVEMLRLQAFPFFLTDSSWNLPLWYLEPVCTALQPYRNDSQVSFEVRQYAQATAARAGWNTMQFLSALADQLFRECRSLFRPAGPPWPSSWTLQAREGSCRDLAVLFCDLCRAMGLAARFVSGYETASAGMADASMHAWSEVYLPGGGWVAYDPSRGLAVTSSHVAVAAGFHSGLAGPIDGTFNGPYGSTMHTSLHLRRHEQTHAGAGEMDQGFLS